MLTFGAAKASARLARLVGAEARERGGVLVDHRLGEHHMADVAVDPPRRSPGVGLEVGELDGEEPLDRLEDLPQTRVRRAPRVDAEARLLLQHARDPLHVRRPRVGVHQALQTDVLVGPQRPAGTVAAVDLELVLEQLVTLLVPDRVTGVDGAELADPDRRPGLPHVGGPLQERRLESVPVDVLPTRLPRVGTTVDEPRQRVVVRGVDAVRQRVPELVELRRVAVAVEEEDVVGIHRPDGCLQAAVEGSEGRHRATSPGSFTGL